MNILSKFIVVISFSGMMLANNQSFAATVAEPETDGSLEDRITRIARLSYPSDQEEIAKKLGELPEDKATVLVTHLEEIYKHIQDRGKADRLLDFEFPLTDPLYIRETAKLTAEEMGVILPHFSKIASGLERGFAIFELGVFRNVAREDLSFFSNEVASLWERVGWPGMFRSFKNVPPRARQKVFNFLDGFLVGELGRIHHGKQEIMFGRLFRRLEGDYRSIYIKEIPKKLDGNLSFDSIIAAIKKVDQEREGRWARRGGLIKWRRCR